jgi:hypothetical protein
METNGLRVIHNTEKKCFEAQAEGHTAKLNYRLDGETILFTHTGVPPALAGRGIGSLLVRSGLDYAKENNLKVTTLCWFVSGYIQRHAEYQELVR